MFGLLCLQRAPATGCMLTCFSEHQTAHKLPEKSSIAHPDHPPRLIFKWSTDVMPRLRTSWMVHHIYGQSLATGRAGALVLPVLRHHYHKTLWVGLRRQIFLPQRKRCGFFIMGTGCSRFEWNSLGPTNEPALPTGTNLVVGALQGNFGSKRAELGTVLEQGHSTVVFNVGKVRVH